MSKNPNGVYHHPYVTIVRQPREVVEGDLEQRALDFLETFGSQDARGTWSLEFSGYGTREDPDTPLGFLASNVRFGGTYLDALYSPNGGAYHEGITPGTRLGFCSVGRFSNAWAKHLELEKIFGTDGRPHDPAIRAAYPELNVDINGFDREACAYITFVHVLPPYRGRTRSLKLEPSELTVFELQTLEMLRLGHELGCSGGLVRTAKDNLPLIKLYERWGFVVAGTYTVYQYHQPTERVIMVRMPDGRPIHDVPLVS